jgi:phosphoribosylformylglycinamidine cyclo-ligase
MVDKSESGGVDYDLIDPFKRAAQRIAIETDGNIRRFGLEVVPESRGDSAFLIRSTVGAMPNLIASVPETLGTKNLVADAYRASSGKTHYDAIAQDTVAMNVNDLITMGALPVVVGAHIAAGSSSWFADEERTHDLLIGWRTACDLSGCVYGPGESPALTDLVREDSAVLSGFGLGIIREPSHQIRSSAIRNGDVMVFLESSGIHANGLTQARKVASHSPKGLEDVLSDGRTFGDALLRPTTIYTPVIESCQDRGIDIHYAVNITGHGLRKLMRAVESFKYIVDEVPPVSPLFEYLIEKLELPVDEAFSSFNMGMGFAVYVDADDADAVIRASTERGIDAWIGGHIEASERRMVSIPELNINYLEGSLRVR